MNLSIDGTQKYLNLELLTESGPIGHLDGAGEAPALEDSIDRSLPGAFRGEMSVRRSIRKSALQVQDSTGGPVTAASTKRLLIYSLDQVVIFDSFDLGLDVTPATTHQVYKAIP